MILSKNDKLMRENSTKATRSPKSINRKKSKHDNIQFEDDRSTEQEIEVGGNCWESGYINIFDIFTWKFFSTTNIVDPRTEYVQL